MRCSDFLLTTDEIRQRRSRRNRAIFGGLLLVILLALGAVITRPGAHAIVRWQARRHAAKALRAIELENGIEAQKEATAAYQLAPYEAASTRAVAWLLSRAHQAEALEFWDRLKTQARLTPADLREEAGVALALGEAERATEAVNQLLVEKGKKATSSDWLLAAEIRVNDNAPAQALAALQHVTTDPAAGRGEQLEAALLELRLANSTPERKRQFNACQRIKRLANGNDSIALDALVFLAQCALCDHNHTIGNSAEQTPVSGELSLDPLVLAKSLEHHPMSRTPHQLLAIDLRIQVAPNEKRTLLQTATERWKSGDDGVLLALGKWLGSHGEYERELEIIPLQRALASRELFLQHLDALGAVGRWEEIRRLLEGESFPLEPVLKHMYLARCYDQLGQKTATENNWHRAFEATAGEPAKLMLLAGYAEKNRATELAAAAYREVTSASPRSRAAWHGQLRLAQNKRETETIHSLLARMLELWPKDAAIQNDEAYTRLLLAAVQGNGAKGREQTKLVRANNSPTEQKLDQIESLARNLVRREPASLPHRTLLALSLLRENRPYSALAVYDNLQVPSIALSPSAMAVHAAVLAATGNPSAAREEAAKIPPTELLPEELALTAPSE